MAGVSGVRTHALFWKTLEDHRDRPHYNLLRTKIRQLILAKLESTNPLSGSDKQFVNKTSLNGIWHFTASRTPDVVIFYTIDENKLNLAMVGSHHDYPFNDTNRNAGERTGRRIRNTLYSGVVESPQWDDLRWVDPEDLLLHPDLPELSAESLDTLLLDVHQELKDGARYMARHGRALDDPATGMPELERYVEALEKARDLILEIRRAHEGPMFWIKRKPDNEVESGDVPTWKANLDRKNRFDAGSNGEEFDTTADDDQPAVPSPKPGRKR